MFNLIFKIITFVTNVLVPLHITFETIHLSKDWPSPLLQTATHALQQQKKRSSLQLLLLKYWCIFTFIYFVVPQSPLYFIFDIVPFNNLFSVIVGCIVTSEIIKNFLKFIEEQDKIIGLLQKMDKSKDNFEMVYNFIFTTINFNNKEYMATTFLFGNLTKLLIIYTKDIIFPNTNYINLIFDKLIFGFIYIKDEIIKETEWDHNKFKFTKPDMGSQKAGNINPDNSNTSTKFSTSNFSSQDGFFSRFTKSFSDEFKKEINKPKHSTQTNSNKEHTPEEFEII